LKGLLFPKDNVSLSSMLVIVHWIHCTKHTHLTIQITDSWFKFFFKYCLLAIRLEGTSVYNLICCLDVVPWKGDPPAMSPQSCRSEVQRLFCLLLGVGCVSTGGLGWDSNLLRRLFILSLMTSLT
jgi:hypothetical protein